MDELCEITECGFPVSECLISDHPKYCGEHLEEWFLDQCKRINEEQMFQEGHPDPVGV
jgi:hypothetical protein